LSATCISLPATVAAQLQQEMLLVMLKGYAENFTVGTVFVL